MIFQAFVAEGASGIALAELRCSGSLWTEDGRTGHPVCIEERLKLQVNPQKSAVARAWPRSWDMRLKPHATSRT